VDATLRQTNCGVTMKKGKPYMTADQLRHLADAKYLEAGLVDEGSKRAELLTEAQQLTFRARFKGWLLEELNRPGERATLH
jgi:hypothetical protein